MSYSWCAYLMWSETDGIFMAERYPQCGQLGQSGSATLESSARSCTFLADAERKSICSASATFQMSGRSLTELRSALAAFLSGLAEIAAERARRPQVAERVLKAADALRGAGDVRGLSARA